VDEGSDIQLALNDATDPSSVDTDAGFEYAFDCGSGYGSFGPENTASCPTSDNGSRTVKGKISDKDGGVSEYTAEVTIENVDPVVTAGDDQFADEGTPTSLDLGSFVDPGADSPWSVIVDWGDGSSDTTFNFNSLTPSVASPDPYSLGLVEHTYDDDDVYSVTVTVTDKDGGFGSDTFGVTVANVAPTAVLSNGGPVDEGSPVTVSFSGQADVSSADEAAGFRYAYDCAGGAFDEAPTYAGGSVDATHECTFADNGSYTVSAAIIDKDDGYRVYTSDVVVENVDPSVTAAADQSADEGASTEFELGSFMDPGADSPWDVSVDWGDGSSDSSFQATSTGALAPASHTYDDDGTYTVTVTVTDKDGGSGSATFEVAVANVAPSAELEHNGPVDEGSAIQLELNNASDPSQADTAAGFEYAFDCGTGSGYGDFGPDNTASCPTNDNGSRDVGGKIRDKDGDVSTYTATVTIDNVAPTATFNAPQSVDEGSNIELSLTNPSDPSSADTTAGFTYAFDCGSGYGDFGHSNTASCPTDDNGSRDVGGKIKDKDGGTREYTAEVTVNNVAPSAAIAGAPTTSPEGTPITVTGGFTDPGSADTHTQAWSVTKNGSPYGSGGSGASFSFTPDDNGTYVVTYTVTDDDGGAGSDSETITVDNVAPTLTSLEPSSYLVLKGTSVSVTGQYSDPGSADTFTCVINWDEPTGTPQTVAGGQTSCTASHTYTAQGTYTVSTKVRDDDGGESSPLVTIITVYDPAAGGFVTGGGWIMSEPGSYAADPAASGKANFGFNSQYKKGSNVPTGETEFQLHFASFNFHSEAYEALVVTGHKAQYRGTGKVNGVTGHRFILTAYDGNVSGGGGVDRFRIKIWRASDGVVVYDTKMGTSDDMDLANPLAISGGSIVIHKSK
jgi:hypothetical protein